MDQTSPARAPSVLIGILLMASAVTLFSVMDGIAKHLAASHHPMQIAWLRYGAHLVLMLAILRISPIELLRTNRPVLQITRGAALLICTVLFFVSIRYIPLADATAIGQVSPLFVTLLSIPILGEKVRARRLSAVVVGMIGALIIVRPGLDVVHWAAILPLIMAFVFALYQIATRILASTERPVSTLFYSALVGTIGTTLVGPFFWSETSLVDFLLMVLVGAIGGFSHYLLILAFRHAPASLLAPFIYVQIVTSTLVGYLFFGDVPDSYTIAGALLVAAAGTYVFYREARLRAAGANAA